MTGDDVRQARIAQDVVDQGFILLSTVVLEVEWVLRSAYSWSRQEVARGLRMITDLPGAIGIPHNIDWAIDRFEQGADLGDVMHLIGATGASAFVTFDKSVAKHAGPTTPLPVETLD
jgi:predicted nucleic-acid-binding protein